MQGQRLLCFHYTRSHAECRALRPLLLAFKPGFQGMDDALFQPGNIALADAKGIGGFLLGVLHAVYKAEAQLHDLPLPGGQLLHGAPEGGALDRKSTRLNSSHPSSSRMPSSA